ncbi:MAG TPA: pilus assembly PilX N-terminal domain-containing protein [Candidatus Saccharimonadales bacterium]|nr:pilus assembly PilX N-terminal domain-containing protein [Candidatus Saccharimonadales bacterium]
MDSLISNKWHKNERGIVSILVVTILTITLSLIAIGFSKLADRELRQASDRELATQAYYAAQSGINDAIAYLVAGGTGFSGCANWPTSPVDGNQYFSQDLSGGAGAAKYSCISVDTSPQVLKATVYPGEPQLLKVSAANLQNLFIAWENQSPSTKWLPAGNSLPPEDSAAGKGATGVLRVGIYGVPPSGTFSDSQLSGNLRVYYLYPNGSITGIPGTTDYTTGSYSVASGPGGTNGNFVPGNCKNPRPIPVPSPDQDPHYCNSEVKNLNSSYTYYLYLTAQYAPLKVSVEGTDNSNKTVDFVKSQAIVDVTGQGSDIIQRLRTTVDLNSQFSLPNYAVQSMETLCKNFTVDISGQGQYGAPHLNETTDPACALPAGGGGVVGGPNNGH